MRHYFLFSQIPFKHFIVMLFFMGGVIFSSMGLASVKSPENTLEKPLEKNITETHQKEPINFKNQRTCFLQAETAFAKGHLDQYKKLKKQLVHYPLYPYLLYAEYEKNIQNLSLEEFQTFIEKYIDTPLAEQLRSRWLQVKAKQEEWKDFLKAYVPSEDVGLQCQFLWAELNTRQDKKPIFEQIIPIWLSGKERPKSCEAVFKAFEKSNLLTSQLVWERIKLAMLADNIKLARYMTRFVKKNEVALVELWIMIHNNPNLVTQRKYFTYNKHPAILEMLIYGVTKIAKNKPEMAIQIWQQIGHEHSFSQKHWASVASEIGLAFATQKRPEAEKWLSEVPDVYASPTVHEWRMRISLAKEDWHKLLHWSSRLPDSLVENETWQYWKGRALEKLNRFNESEPLLNKVAQTRSYYGFLASQHLGKPYFIAHQKFALDPNALLSIAQKKSVQRARELYALNRESKARVEWVYNTQRMSDSERHAAAALALRWGLPNWSILALSKATDKNALELRFPIVHSAPILQEAKRNQLDPAMVFAVTRQESAFVTNAKSSSGALGLMQLMPATAQLVAKKNQMKLKGHTSLFEPATNIRLGAHYLKMMLDSHENHPILAAAAYNAGPGRIRKWLPEKDTPADAWVENIPFKETREYVKNVMTYTIIYQQLLGHKAKQPKRLPVIRARD